MIAAAELDDNLRTVIVVPMTCNIFSAPFRVPLALAGTQFLIVLDQLRTIDKVRWNKRLGAASAQNLGAVLQTLQEMFAS